MGLAWAPSTSWSWASIDGPVCDVVRSYPSKTARDARVISCEVEFVSSSNPFGKVLSGLLAIRGFLVEARNAEASWLVFTRLDSNAQPMGTNDEDKWCLIHECSPLNQDLIPHGIAPWQGLILNKLPDGTFNRIGHFSQNLNRELWEDPLPEFSDLYPDLLARKAVGTEAVFPSEGSRQTIVIV
jgi:hypothetical protein